MPTHPIFLTIALHYGVLYYTYRLKFVCFDTVAHIIAHAHICGLQPSSAYFTSAECPGLRHFGWSLGLICAHIRWNENDESIPSIIINWQKEVEVQEDNISSLFLKIHTFAGFWRKIPSVGSLPDSFPA